MRFVMMENAGTGFGDAMKHRVVEEFVVAYYNGSLKPNVAEKNMMTGKEIEYLMDGPQFEKIPKSDMWTYSTAVGTGYQYRVVYRDKRFSDLERLLQVYAGTSAIPEDEKAAAEQRLYELILQLIREGRLPKSFRLVTTKDAENEKVAALVDELGRSLEELGKRVRKLEEQLNSPKEEGVPPPVPETPVIQNSGESAVSDLRDDAPSSTSSLPSWVSGDVLPSREMSSQSKAP
jgi:hypothetical protein